MMTAKIDNLKNPSTFSQTTVFPDLHAFLHQFKTKTFSCLFIIQFAAVHKKQ